MAYLPAVLGTPLKGRVLERLLRGGAATLGELATDVDASRQQVATVVGELSVLGVLKEGRGEDRRSVVVTLDEEHPFLGSLRILAMDGGAWFETPETWQTLLARHFVQDWYVGGYAAIRRVMQPIDFESTSVLVHRVPREKEKVDVAAVIGRACRMELKLREVDSIPPEVTPVAIGGREIWFATPARGFVEAWRAQEIPLYGLMLCFVQGIHDRVYAPADLLAVARRERIEPDVRALLAAVRDRLAVRDLTTTRTRALKTSEKKALEQALNTVMG